MVGHADPYRENVQGNLSIWMYAIPAVILLGTLSYALLANKIKRHRDGKPRKMTHEEKILNKVNQKGRKPY